MTHSDNRPNGYRNPTFELLDYLPTWFDSGDQSPNWYLFEPIGEQFREFKLEIDDIEEASFVQTADTIPQLAGLALLVGLKPRSGESIEHFRARIIAQFQIVTSNGTVQDLLSGLSNILKTEIRDIGPYYEHGKWATVYVPHWSLERSDLTDAEIAEFGTAIVAAPYWINALTKGTLLYVSPETYYDCEDGTDSWNNHPGFDGLDTNGQPKGNGGTYSGVIGDE